MRSIINRFRRPVVVHASETPPAEPVAHRPLGYAPHAAVRQASAVHVVPI